MTKILFAGGGTGGHLMPALAIARAVEMRHPDWEFFFAGAERGVEAHVLPQRLVRHQLFPFEPIHRQRPWRNLRWPFLIGRLIRDVDDMLERESPDVVIGTGGYVSGPVVHRASKRGIPTAILELDVKPGIATRWLAARVLEVWLGTPESEAGLPVNAQAKTRVIGAPITPPDRSRRESARHAFGFTDDRPVLVITGGSQGSLAINRLVAEWLAGGGGAGAHIIWAAGKTTYAEFASFDDPPRVRVVPFLDPMADAWSVADLCVSRAGMMTIAELCAWGIPSVLIPLPTAAADHQTHNARALEAAGGAVCLLQPGLTAPVLGAAIDELLHDPIHRQALARQAAARGRPDAAAEIAERVELLVTR